VRQRKKSERAAMRKEQRNREKERMRRLEKKRRRKRWVGLGQPDPNRFLSDTLPSSVMDRVASFFNPISPSLKSYKPNPKIH
jgi:hypothetical protein